MLRRETNRMKISSSTGYRMKVQGKTVLFFCPLKYARWIWICDMQWMKRNKYVDIRTGAKKYYLTLYQTGVVLLRVSSVHSLLLPLGKEGSGSSRSKVTNSCCTFGLYSSCSMSAVVLTWKLQLNSAYFDQTVLKSFNLKCMQPSDLRIQNSLKFIHSNFSYKFFIV